MAGLIEGHGRIVFAAALAVVLGAQAPLAAQKPGARPGTRARGGRTFIWSPEKAGPADRASLQRTHQPLLVLGPDRAEANLAGKDLSGQKLRFANFRRANLRAANLSGADLEGAQLRGADLSRANLNGANLRGASLSGANLTGADLTGARLRHASYDARTTWPAGFDPVKHGATRLNGIQGPASLL